MKTLAIVWQRLVTPAQTTCPRCRATEAAVRHAFTTLQAALEPLGIRTTLESAELDTDAFQSAPAESNRIWIAGQPLEHWLGATVGSSRCCGACGDAGCRTVVVGKDTYEAIPEKLILQAALTALPELENVPA